MKPVRDYGRILLGLVVVAFGALFLLDSAGVLDSGQAISDWWPALIVAMALFQFAEGTHGVVGPSIFLGGGSLLLLFSTGVLSGNVWDYIWPIAIIVVGIYIISRWRASGKEEVVGTDDVIVADGIFGGPTVASGSQAFRAASLTAVFGGVTLDLRAAKPAPEGANVKATAVFGGIEILVPHGWRVGVKATPIFGGIDDKTVHDSDLPDDAPVLNVDGLALFGGVEIKHEKK
jgi:predicted membrane protein